MYAALVDRMKGAGRIALAAAVVFGAIPPERILASEIDMAAMSGSHGEIRSGERFGIQIGSSHESAMKVLSALGFHTSETTLPKNWACIDLERGEREDMTFDNSWRGGVICVASRDGRISAIGWNFSPFGSLFP